MENMVNMVYSSTDLDVNFIQKYLLTHMHRIKFNQIARKPMA